MVTVGSVVPTSRNPEPDRVRTRSASSTQNTGGSTLVITGAGTPSSAEA